MKILLYTEGQKTIGKSGLGKAIKHQMKALEDEKIEYTLNPKDDYDILHINTYFPKSYFLAKNAKRMGKKVVYHAHSTEEDFRDGFIFCRQISPLFKKWLIKCYSLGDVIVTPTPYSKKLLDGYGMNKEIYAISNGIDLDLFKKDKKAGETFRRTYGYKKNDKVIIGIGLYIERKGIVDFVELAKRLPEYKFIWFGYSPLAAATKPVKKAVNTKLPNLTFAGYVEQDMIKAALNGCDLYLFPTLEETEGIPVIEACAVGADAIIRDIPIFDDWLIDGVNVYKAKDVDEFELKIKKFFNGELKSVANKAYDVAKERDLNNIGKQLKEVYTHVLKKKKTKKEIEKEKNDKLLKIRNWSIFFTSILLIITLFLAKDKFNINKKYTDNFTYKNNNYNITLYTTSKRKADKSFKDIENIITNYLDLKDNELKFIYTNDFKTPNLTLSSDLYNMLKEFDKYNTKNNYLDIYTGNINDVWSIAKKNNTIPLNDDLVNAQNSQQKIKFLKNNEIENNHANIYVDSVINGYILLQIENYLKDKKIDKYLISNNANILIGKYYEKNDKYLILIASPFKGNDNILQTLKIENRAISTKAIHQNGYDYQEKTYSNILSTNTLMPADNMISVTVVAPNSLIAEELATKLFLMPIEEGIELVDDDEEIDAIWCYYDNDNSEKCIRTEGIYNYK